MTPEPANTTDSKNEQNAVLSLLLRLRALVTANTVIRRLIVVTVFAASIGAVSAAAALLFVQILDYLNDLFLISSRSRIMESNPTKVLAFTVAVPAIGGLIVGLIVQFLIRTQTPEGAAEVIRATQARQGSMRIWPGFLSTVAALISLGSGASLGHYGPLVHLGGLLGSIVSRVTGSIRSMGTIGVGCGVAAAIAAAFNAPIAGVVFAHEVVLRHRSLRAFAPITIAATVAYVINNLVFKSAPLFRIEQVHVNHELEFLAFVVVGIVGALIAVGTMRAFIVSREWAALVPVPDWVKPGIAGALLGTFAIALPEVLGTSQAILRFGVIEGAYGQFELLTLIVSKILVTALCLGFGFVGGVFSPSLVIGVLLGALMGSMAQLLLGDATSDVAVYAICGMVAVASPIIGAPLSMILIVFEMTHNYELTTAVMVSAVFANMLAFRLFGRSWFDVQLLGQGFDISLGRDRVILEEHSIARLVTKDHAQVDEYASVEETLNLLAQTGRVTAYVVNDDGQYLGSVGLPTLLKTVNDQENTKSLLIDLAQRESVILTTQDSIWESMERIGGFVGESIAVIESDDDDRLIGVINEAAIVRAYLDTVYEIRREENAAG